MSKSKFTFEDYREALEIVGPWERERILADADRHLSWTEMTRLIRIVSQDAP